MKQIKKLLSVALFATIATTSLNAQTKEKAKEKEHKCTAACTKDKHQLAHGEKGHKCGEACKKAETKKP